MMWIMRALQHHYWSQKQVLTVLKLQQQEQQELPRPRIRASSSSTMRQQGPCLCPARCWVGAQ